MFSRACRLLPRATAPAQVAGDEADRLHGGGVRHRVSVFGDIGLYGVGQGIHPGRRGQGGRFTDHQQRIVDRDRRQVAPADDHKLHFGFGVGQDAVAGDLAGGAGGGVDRDDRRQRVGQGLDSGILVQIALMGGGDADAFAAIVRAAAAHGDDDVALFAAKHGEAVAHVGVFRVRLDAVKDRHLDPGLPQIMQGFVHRAIFNCPQAFVGDQQGFFSPPAAGSVRRLRKWRWGQKKLTFGTR